MAEGENGSPTGIDSHDGIYRFAAGERVILAHSYPCVPPLVDYTVGVAQRAVFRAFGRERLRFGAIGVQRVEALIDGIGKVEDAVRDGPCSATIFVNAGAGVEWRGENIAPRLPAHHHAAAGFLGTRFEPVDVITVEADFGESDGLGDNQVGSNRR